MTEGYYKAIKKGGYSYSQKSAGSLVTHIYSPKKGGILCGLTMMLAYFNPERNRSLCENCVKAFLAENERSSNVK